MATMVVGVGRRRSRGGSAGGGDGGREWGQLDRAARVGVDGGRDGGAAGLHTPYAPGARAGS